MGLITAAVVGTATIASSFIGGKSAKAAAKHTARMTELNNDIKKAQLFANAAISNRELEASFVSDEATATVTTAVQGRRQSGGSVQAISAERKNMLDTNKKRIEQNAKMGGGMLDINTGSAYGATSAQIAANKAAQWSGIIKGSAGIVGAGLEAMASKDK